MESIDVEKLKEKLHPVAIALSCIGEVCVDVSKQHISAERAIDKIRRYLRDTDIIGSRYRVDKLIEDCMEHLVYNWFEDYGKRFLEINGYDYPSCCDGCSNNPKNGGSGICNCTLPYMQNPIMYNTATPIDDFYMTAATSTGVYIFENEKHSANNQLKANADRIAEAVERTKKYIKE